MSAQPQAVPDVEVFDLSKRFGSVQALHSVSLRFPPGRMHALLGENGAGKSTLAKCLMGYHRADSGKVLVDGVERRMGHPQDAHALGLGMVYQHFTCVPQMTVAENFLLGRDRLPAMIDWAHEHATIRAFMASMPFRLDPERRVATLAAGEKQKLEILKQLYLGRRFLVLDEPTSVLTPDEADDVLGEMRRLADAGRLAVILITHKFREVMQFAHDVSVLRAGHLVGQMEIGEASQTRLAALMFGDAARQRAVVPASPGEGVTREQRLFHNGDPQPPASPPYLQTTGLCADSDRGVPALAGIELAVWPCEIVGIAGVSGNGQRELVEVLAGQRPATSGEIRVAGAVFTGTRRQLRTAGVSLLTEEPLANAAVRSMSVMENLALRQFDAPPLAHGWFLSRSAMRAFADRLVARYRIRTPSPQARLETLSGGNVQRTVLARELSRDVRLIVLQNPCFGLDAVAVAEIRSQIALARDAGAAVLLISEDLDEIFELSDRILVMSGGRIAFATDGAEADRYEIGRHMAQAQAA